MNWYCVWVFGEGVRSSARIIKHGSRCLRLGGERAGLGRRDSEERSGFCEVWGRIEDLGVSDL